MRSGGRGNPPWVRDAIRLRVLRFTTRRDVVERNIERPLTDAEWEHIQAAHKAGIQHLDEILVTEGYLTVVEPPESLR